ncbi:hypothetical protein CEX98_20590 [Pseudoalteromonas piscicida]|uniref:Uncharacterized protein n=1 Tax=Pseudoalteromonas piscicida TaxID=43662 RepID=A0A2A5JKF6_PSEO7|nr:hypothetical protein CEX98_20590 [Pseudoalteromonas piscicida]
MAYVVLNVIKPSLVLDRISVGNKSVQLIFTLTPISFALILDLRWRKRKYYVCSNTELNFNEPKHGL